MRMRFSILCVAISTTCMSSAFADRIEFIGCESPTCRCETECSGFWDVPGNWEGNAVPQADDVAWIPIGHKAIVRVTADPVGAIEIDAHEGTHHHEQTKIIIANGVVLPLAGLAGTDSVVDGTLTTGSGGTLRIDGDLTIRGDGDIYLGGGKITDNGGGGVLTIASSSGCSPLARSCAIELWSDIGGEVKVSLTNDAYVVATADSFAPGADCAEVAATLKLTTSSKNGSGFWIAEESGHLVVSAEVKGSGTWVIEDVGTECTSKIVIDACCDELTGNVRLSEGDLLVRSFGYFCTTGDVELESSPPSGGADVVVYTGRTATFGEVSCSCPS